MTETSTYTHDAAGRLTYDVTDRHMGTTLTDGSTVTYVWDVSGRVVSRTEDPAGPTPASTVRYSFAAGTLFAVLNTSNVVLQRELSRLIAATARSTGRLILTNDRAARFEDLPDVDAILLT